MNGGSRCDDEAVERYRWRTLARTYLPYFLSDRIPKGARNCGAHEWYLASEREWRCYHCVVGVTHEDPSDERG